MIGFGVYTPDAPGGGIAPVDALETRLRRKIGTVLWFQQWEPDNGWMDGWIKTVHATGRKPLLTWEPWLPFGEIAAGAHDDYARTFARSLAATGSPVYLRFAHEMNGNWYPWAGRPDEYVKAWRRLHRLFQEQGARNVRWVWCPNAGDWPAGNLMENYWPGRAYVAVVGLDGYNFGAASYGWRTFREVFDGAYRRAAALDALRPIWICETACAPEAPVGTSKPDWIRDMWADAPVRYQRLREIVWFSADKERDWRADDTPAASAAFAQ